MAKMISLAKNKVWTTRSISTELFGSDQSAQIKRTERWINKNGLDFLILDERKLLDEHNRMANNTVTKHIVETNRKKRKSVLYASIQTNSNNISVLFANDGRDKRRWIFLDTPLPSNEMLLNYLKILAYSENKDVLIIPTGLIVLGCRILCRKWKSNQILLNNKYIMRIGIEVYSHSIDDIYAYVNEDLHHKTSTIITHLDLLEAESIHIMREVIAEANNPVMLYSLGKDSSVMLHLARKAFYPSLPPFPLLHIDTRWKFQAMYEFRNYILSKSGMDIIVHINPEGLEKDINPFDHGSAIHTDIMKTQGLKQALENYKFDVAFGGARRDEEKSRSKERIFSFRNSSHSWDPKNQRPELWNQYNCRKNSEENIRVFPLSNWTELDIWQYIYKEQIPIVPLYFAAERPVIERNNMLLMVDDHRIKLLPKEKIKIKKVRFRTLGCYPLTSAFVSDADDLSTIVLELLNSKTSERQGRAIDNDAHSSMEKKKKEGYF